MKWNRLNLLYSYHYLRKNRDFEEMALAFAPYVTTLIDSGAFSNYEATKKAHMEGKDYQSITLEEYIEACKRYHSKVWQYIMLDVIKNRDASRRNLQGMVDAGLKPMPVFVYPETVDRVPALMEVNTTICVAGGVRSSREFIAQRYQRVYAASGGRAKIHGLAFVNYPQYMQLPLYSVDSSTWTTGSRFGATMLWGGARKGLTTYNYQLVMGRHDERALRVREFLIENGVPARMLKDRAQWRNQDGIPSAFTMNGYMQMQHYSELHDKHLFLAVGNRHWLVLLLAAAASSTPGRFEFQDFKARAAYLLSIKDDLDRFVPEAVQILQSRFERGALERE